LDCLDTLGSDDEKGVDPTKLIVTSDASETGKEVGSGTFSGSGMYNVSGSERLICSGVVSSGRDVTEKRAHNRETSRTQAGRLDQSSQLTPLTHGLGKRAKLNRSIKDERM